MSTAVQVPDSYWVVPRRLLAGAYPGARDAADAEARVARFLEAGVTTFVDLTEAGELAPYALLLPDGVRTIRKAVQDFSCPRPGEMDRILDLIDAELESGEIVYVHCRGGLGRTGTVVGCWLVRHGMHGEQALEWIAAARRDAPGGARSPETDEQRRFILGWRDRARGSKGQVRTYVNRRSAHLSRAVLRALPELARRDAVLVWTVPRAERELREPRDREFLKAIGRADLAPELARFWPAGGPSWDVLGVAVLPYGPPGVLLGEGKSYPDEMKHPCTAGRASRSRIEQALAHARRELGVAEDRAGIWIDTYYQYANRLAHLVWLRSQGIEAWLVNLLFVGDSTHGHPTTREQWETAIATVDEAMGLARRVDGLAEVYLPAVTQAEFIGR